MADRMQRPVTFDEFHHMMGECHRLSAVARAANARLSEYEHSEESDEIQDVKMLLAIVETKAKIILDFLDA